MATTNHPILHAELSAERARAKVLEAASTDEAGNYLYREVGFSAIAVLAKSVDMRVVGRCDRRWCDGLAKKVREVSGAKAEVL